jgi:hypothetical protein
VGKTILTRIACAHGIDAMTKRIEVNERSLTPEGRVVNTKMEAALGRVAMDD